jgi:hypothetical protein
MAADMAIETLLHTDRSLAGSLRSILDRLMGPGFENVDAPEEGRIEIDCLDGETGDEWGMASPEVSAMDAFSKLKEKANTVRVRVSLRTGCFLLFPGFVVLQRPDDDYDDFEEDPRARQIILREAMEVGRHFGAREVMVAGDAASDFLGTETTSWDGLKEVLEAEDIQHLVLPVVTAKGEIRD